MKRRRMNDHTVAAKAGLGEAGAAFAGLCLRHNLA